MEELEVDDSLSIDDFIKELENKEKDLNIFSEMVIELDERKEMMKTFKNF